MNGFEYDKDDPYSIVSTKTLRSRLRSNLPDLQPAMQRKIEAFFKREMLLAKTTDGTCVPHRYFLSCATVLRISRLEISKNISHGNTINSGHQQRRGYWGTSLYVL